MTATATLPIWVLLLFCIVLIGFITLIYSHGNWRTTFAFVGLATASVLVINGINAWSNFIDSHFIGQFDQLGIPFREAGPGWTLLSVSWPLWLAPTGIFTLIAIGLGWRLHQLYLQPRPNAPVIAGFQKIITQPATRPSINTPTHTTADIQQNSVGHLLEMESLKHELISLKEKLALAVKIAEEQVDKNQDLEIQIIQLEEEQRETVSELQEKIAELGIGNSF